jgi:hypothetical protein
MGGINLEINATGLINTFIANSFVLTANSFIVDLDSEASRSAKISETVSGNTTQIVGS